LVGKLEEEPPNPKNSIQGRIVSSGFDSSTPEEELPVFWPLFPFEVMPIKEGEHVYVTFEDNINKNHGLWITRIPENNTVDARNLVLGSKKYEKNVSKVGLEKASQDTEIDIQKPKQSSEFKVEEVPPFIFRVGDRGTEGSNNTLFLMSRDRVDKPDSGETDKAGAIFLVAGRSKDKDLDLKEDKSTLLISMMSDVDENMGMNAGPKAGATAVIAAKSDQIRLFGRKGIKIIVKDGDLFLYGKNLYFSDKADNVEPGILGDTLKKVFDDMLDAIGDFQLATPAGPAPMKPLMLAIKAKISKGLTDMLSKNFNMKKN